MAKSRVLFVCVHNSARSQMAQALLNFLAGDKFNAESAGLEPGVLNPVAVEAMRRMGIDISRNGTRDAFELYKRGELYRFVITVCDGANGERCPVFPGVAKRLHWAFPDPAEFTGTFEEKVAATVEVRDAIRSKIKSWLKELEASGG